MLLRIDSTGGRRAVRKPPFCRMRRFFVNDVFLIASALTSFLLRRKSYAPQNGQKLFHSSRQLRTQSTIAVNAAVAAILDTIHIASSVSLSISLEQIATFGRSVKLSIRLPSCKWRGVHTVVCVQHIYTSLVVVDYKFIYTR